MHIKHTFTNLKWESDFVYNVKVRGVVVPAMRVPEVHGAVKVRSRTDNTYRLPIQEIISAALHELYRAVSEL